MKSFFASLGFLTRIPVPDFPFEEGILAKGILWFPVVGLIVGIINCAVYFIAEQFLNLHNGMASALLAVISGAIVTGGFHLDGLADTCDGIFSTRSRERSLEIMRDSRIGTHGALALIFDILLKAALISQISFYSRAYFAILLMPVAGKMATPILTQSHYAREGEGLGNFFVGQIEAMQAAFSVFLGIFLILIFLGFSGFPSVLACIAAAFLFLKAMEKKLGGMTGDTLGAGAEIGELVFLLVYCATYTRIWY